MAQILTAPADPPAARALMIGLMPRHESESFWDYLGPGGLSSFLVSAAMAVVTLGIPIWWRLRTVVRTASRDERGEADALLVPGRCLVDDRPTEVFRRRLDHASDLLREGLAPRIIVAGGLTGRATRTEADAGREYLEQSGVEPAAIVCEGGSRHTLENLSNVRETLRAEGWERVLVCSDPLHHARIEAFAEGFGIDVRFSPAREAVPHGFGWWARALREACLLHWYHTGRAYSRLIGAQSHLDRVT